MKISFSLWGQTEPVLVRGAFENLRFAKLFFPGWKCVLYVEAGHPGIPAFRDAGFQIVEKPFKGGHEGLFWRYEAGADDVAIFRDLDKRINARDAAAVKEWLRSGLPFHVMRDVPHGNQCVPGGLWGCRPLETLPEFINHWPTKGAPGDDQVFLRHQLWPIMKKRGVLVHSVHPTHPPEWGEHDVWKFPKHPPLDPQVFGPYVGGIPT